MSARDCCWSVYRRSLSHPKGYAFVLSTHSRRNGQALYLDQSLAVPLCSFGKTLRNCTLLDHPFALHMTTYCGRSKSTLADAHGMNGNTRDEASIDTRRVARIISLVNQIDVGLNTPLGDGRINQGCEPGLACTGLHDPRFKL